MDSNRQPRVPYSSLRTVRKRDLADSDSEGSPRSNTDMHQFPRKPAFKRARHNLHPGEHPTVLYLHRVDCDHPPGGEADHSQHATSALYLDCPRLFDGDDKASQLRGIEAVFDEEDLLDSASIVVYKVYSCSAYLNSHESLFEEIPLPVLQEQFLRAHQAHFFRLRGEGPPADPSSVRIQLQPSDVLDDMYSIMDDSPILQEWSEEQSLTFPFPFYFHHKEAFRQTVAWLGELTTQQWTAMFLECIDELSGSDHREAGQLFSQGFVDKKHFSKLFRSEDVVVTRKDGIYLAYKVSQVQQSLRNDRVSLQCWSYDFDGGFNMHPTTLTVKGPAKPDPITVHTLEVFPLRLDITDMETKLRDRGKKFWACRERKYVRYTAPQLPFESQTAQPRYMVDYSMYKLLHPNVDQAPNVDASAPDGPRSVSIKDLESFPDAKRDEAMLLLPAHIQGFGFLDKKWRTLLVDHIEDVSWNTAAFDHLVLEKTKKDLVKALVTVHLKTRRGVDLIEGKGNGLIILLHGGPGTGKTLTAESVAEIANKPLYRVTCGDMGIDPEGVEKYLDSVLHIGTVWDCVVLLDEADIFLERRTTEDIKRNALVSVFLRVLEYYDGILILTTNRIGLFDEAFKSRIQLSIHYPTLDEVARSKVWLSALRSIPPGQVEYDLQQLLLEVSELAKTKLNGRQIRNTVHCAMQLAIFKEEPLESSHFRTVIGITMEFERFIQDVRGEDDDQAARNEGTR